MNKQYCVQCGTPASYESSPPNFCPGCGKPFNKAGSVSVSSNPEKEEENTTGGDLSFLDRKDQLAKDWSVSHSHSTRQTVQDIIAVAPNPNHQRQTRQAPSDVAGLEGKDLLKHTMKECAKPTESKVFGK